MTAAASASPLAVPMASDLAPVPIAVPPSVSAAMALLEEVDRDPSLLKRVEYTMLADWIVRMAPHAATARSGVPAAAAAQTPSSAAPKASRLPKHRKSLLPAPPPLRPSTAAAPAAEVALATMPDEPSTAAVPAPSVSGRRSSAAAAQSASSVPASATAASAPAPIAPSAMTAERAGQSPSSAVAANSPAGLASDSPLLDDVVIDLSTVASGGYADGAASISSSPLMAMLSAKPRVHRVASMGSQPTDGGSASDAFGSASAPEDAKAGSGASATSWADSCFNTAPPSSHNPSHTAQRRSLNSEPTPCMHSPLKSRRERRESALSTPSLGGSPPKSVGKVLLRHSGALLDVLGAGVPTPELYDHTRHKPSEPTPELRSPPKSVKRLTAPRSAPQAARTAGIAPCALEMHSGGELTATVQSSAETAAAGAEATSPSWTVAPPTPTSGRQLRNTPARQARASRDAREGHASARCSSARARGGASRSRHGASSAHSKLARDERAGIEGDDPSAPEVRGLCFDTSSPTTPGSVAAPCVGQASMPSARCEPAADSFMSGAVEPSPREATDLQLDCFPPHFQRGGAAEQLKALHAALASANAPLTAVDLVEALASSPCKFELRRVLLLLEVMFSRRVVLGDGDGAERRWRVAPRGI